jgi:hypothetical protein
MEKTMAVRRTRSSKAAKQAVELAFAVPQVIAHRMSRMAAAGTRPSARDQREFWMMGFEKVLAFNQSWWAMFAEAGRINQQIMASMLRAAWFPWMTQAPRFPPSAARLQRAAIDIATKGVAPIHRRAVANAKRLGGSRR